MQGRGKRSGYRLQGAVKDVACSHRLYGGRTSQAGRNQNCRGLGGKGRPQDPLVRCSRELHAVCRWLRPRIEFVGKPWGRALDRWTELGSSKPPCSSPTSRPHLAVNDQLPIHQPRTAQTCRRNSPLVSARTPRRLPFPTLSGLSPSALSSLTDLHNDPSLHHLPPPPRLFLAPKSSHKSIRAENHKPGLIRTDPGCGSGKSYRIYDRT